ncbi:unnamed protein product [Meganyctiphanes norvegica]|uniref:Uncharacterized protein n=1 Tax=Meganyctiphanes norvegica TaxID=48144 RepID=A0AAV2QX75_MEGNR
MSSDTCSTTRAATVFVTIVALLNTLQWGPGGVQAGEGVGMDIFNTPILRETCSIPHCIQKCCEDGNYFSDYYICWPGNSSLKQWSPTMILEDREDVDLSKLQILYGMPCGFEEVTFYTGTFVILQDGRLEGQDLHINQLIRTSKFCLDYNQDIEQVWVVFCEPVKEEPDTESRTVGRLDEF